MISSSGRNRPSPRLTSRGSTDGTLTRANCSAPVMGFASITARLIDRPRMYGKGWDGSTAKGVRMGKIRSENKVRMRPFSSSDSSAQRRISMPSSTSPGRTSSANTRDCSETRSWVRARMASWSSRGSIPATEGTATPASIRRLRPATRTMKNSSRLDEKMARNFALSSRGMRSVSRARSSTRSLKASHDSSRSL